MFKSKYIITADGNAIVFSSALSHSQFKSFNPISAGFVRLYTRGFDVKCQCSGISTSLKLNNRGEEDEEIITVQILLAS